MERRGKVWSSWAYALLDSHLKAKGKANASLAEGSAIFAFFGDYNDFSTGRQRHWEEGAATVFNDVLFRQTRK